MEDELDFIFNSMKFSLVTVTYNSVNTLRDTIQSVLLQSYPEIEYIVVDGLSTDGTIDVIKEYEPQYADLYYVAQYDTSKIIRHWITGEKRSFSKGWHPAHPTFYVKREVYQKYGTFDLSFKFAADFELMLRLMEKDHIRTFYLPEPLVRMRLGGTTSKSLSNIKRGNMECLNAFRKNGIPVSMFYPLYRLLPKLIQFFQ